MLDCDRISLGWQVWLTPRQTRIIYDALVEVGRKDGHSAKLVEWFGMRTETIDGVEVETCDWRGGIIA